MLLNRVYNSEMSTVPEAGGLRKRMQASTQRVLIM